MRGPRNERLRGPANPICRVGVIGREPEKSPFTKTKDSRDGRQMLLETRSGNTRLQAEDVRTRNARLTGELVRGQSQHTASEFHELGQRQ